MVRDDGECCIPPMLVGEEEADCRVVAAQLISGRTGKRGENHVLAGRDVTISYQTCLATFCPQSRTRQENHVYTGGKKIGFPHLLG